MVPTLLVILTLAVLYWFPIRRWMSRWGASPSDLIRVMAGDELLGLKQRAEALRVADLGETRPNERPAA